MTAITGSNGDDFLTGTAGNDTINSGHGDDSVSGGAGTDSINGGAGDDRLDGGSGSDQLNGGSGNDTLVYNVSENIAAGTKDVYTGGAGVDTLELQLTRAQWLDSATQTQIAAYLAHLAAVTNARTGEVSNGSASDFVFSFGSSTLTLQMTEVLRVLVDGVELNPANESVRALGDAGTTTEDGPGVHVYVLQNDVVPDLVKSLTLASAPAHGTATLVQPAMDDPSSWYFEYQPRSADFQHLAAGESATDTFTYEVKDADGGTSVATATITITGTNDGPVVTAQDLVGAVSEQLAPAGQLSDGGVIGFGDADRSDVHLVSATGTPVGSVLGSLTAVMGSDSTGTGTGGQLTWTYTVNATAVEYLAAGETRVESFTITLDDQHGGLVTRQIDVTITGTNDAPAISAADASGAVTEDAATPTLSDSGTIRFDDVDLSDAHSVSVAVDPGNTLGGVLTAVVGDAATSAGDGAVSWNYSVSHAATQHLAAGQTVTENFTVRIGDGHGGAVDQQVAVTITGTNDVPVIGGLASGAVSEDASAPDLSTSGALTIADVDQGQSNFMPQASTAGSNGYGSFTLAADGSWTYTADNSQAAIQQLGAGQSLSDSFTASSSDGTASQIVTVTIAGTNDVPVIGGVASGAVSEDASAPDLSTSGALTIADVDQGQSNFAPQASATGSNGYGSFTLAADGSWTFTADNSRAAIQQLGAGQSISDSFTAVSSDGTASQVVTVTITGTNDVPVIGGVASGAMSEDDSTRTLSTSGALTIADVDAGESSFTVQAGTVGSNGHGNFTLAADGNWTFTADNSQAAIQQLGAGQTISDSFTAVSSDGSASRVVTVTITGTNDVPVIGGVASGAVSEDDSTPNLSTSGALTIADIDQGQSNFAPQASTTGSNGYGSFTLAANGSWTFTADNSQSAIQQLGAGQSLSDSFTAISSDGTASQVVTVTIAGTNDAPVLSAAGTPVLASVNEDAGAPVGAVGTLVSSLVNSNPPAGGLDNVSDADNGAVTGIALTGVNAANGTWWYSMNGGATWATVGEVTNSSALLLAADSNTRVCFQGDSNFSGTVSDAITFRAWDQSSGMAGTTVSTVPNGGSTAYSNAIGTASLTVDAVNDNPVAVADRIIVSNNTAVTVSVDSLLGNDTDIDGLALTITAVGSAVGISGLTLDAANGTISFTSGNTAGATAGSFQYTVSDGAGGTATATATIDIRAASSGNGADTIDLGAAGTYQASFIDGRGGADNLTGGASGDVFIGGSGNGADTLLGSSGNDLLVGGDGNDTLSGGAGNDVLRGGLGSNDSMNGGAGSEDLLDFSDGTAAVNFMLVQSAASTGIANGTAGLGNNDTYQNIEGVIGTDLADTLTGSASNDIIRGGKGNDTLDGGNGTGDLLDFCDGTAGLTFTLTQGGSATNFNTGAAGLGTDSYRNFEGVIGTAFADSLTGSASNDQLRGGGGNDVIDGLAGDDRILGGAGADHLTGGADNDTFVFDSAPNAVDTITDFDASGSGASGDLVELSRGTFTALSTASGSTLSATEFASLDGGGAGDAVGAGVRVIYDSATGNLYYDADGASAASRTLVATLTLSDPGDTFDYNDIKAGL